MTPHYDEPADLAHEMRRRPRPLLLAFDVDGVLAPIVARADDAVLLPGVAAALEQLTALEPNVAIVSGRSRQDLQRFGFPGAATVVGSHGMEIDALPVELSPTESDRLLRLTELAEKAASEAGDGAWVEQKPASVAVHVREADTDAGEHALAELERRTEEVDGAHSIAGSQVLELFARSASKGQAMVDLRRDLQIATCAFVGDDVTDEAAFAALEPGDVAIKVGDADTIAAHRLRDPDAVLELLRALVATAP